MPGTKQQSPATAAPWKAAFLSDLSQMDSPEFVLSTLHTAPADALTPYLPRARFCIFRGMWAELPENKHNDAPSNERIFESDMPTFTTDVRMHKVGELFASSAGKANSHELTLGTGGGGPVEAVFWAKPVSVQWRIKGTAFVVANDIEGEDGSGESSGVRTVKTEVGERMRVVQPGKEGDWSWSRELTGHFGNCSPGMRGTWRNPPPGTKAGTEPDASHQLGQKITNLHDEIARSNFRVVIIRPDEVESVDLSDPVKARRQHYAFKVHDDQGVWTHETQWP